MTLIGTKLNLHLLYLIQCMMSMGSPVDMFLLSNASGKFITLMHLTPSQVLIMTNFTMPWSNLRTTQIVSSTSSSTMLIMHVTVTTMRQWRPPLSLSWLQSLTTGSLPSSQLVVYWRHQEGDIQAYYSTRTHAHEYYTQEMIPVSESHLERASSWQTSGYRYHLLQHSGDQLWHYLCSALCWY